MIRAFRAELLKLRRPLIWLGGGAVLPLLAVLGTVLVFATAKASPTGLGRVGTAPGAGGGATVALSKLGESGGLTLGFASAGTLVGLLVFVLFISSFSGEYGQGTIRMLLTRQPRRGRLLLGKLLALLACTAAALLAAELLSAVAAVIMAQVRDVPMGDWFGGAGLARAAGDFANALLSAAMFGVAGATLGVLLRATPLALGVGFVWIGPFEHILQFSWSGAARWMPGLLFDSVGTGGAASVAFGRALALGAAYATLAGVVATTTFLRRDVSA